MKNITMLASLTALGLLFASCASDISEPKMSSNPTAPIVANVVLPDSFVVSRADSVLRFSWSAADFGFASSTTYMVQVSDSSSFGGSHVGNLLTTQRLSGSAKVSDVNTLILSWNYSIGTAVTIYYRVGASVTSSLPAVYSSTKSTTLTPYDAVINYPMVYVPGSYQGWSPGAANGRLYSYGFNSQYSSIVRLIDATTTSTQFKITPAPNWDNDWGGTLTASGANYSGTLVPKGSNFEVNNACYVLTVDVTALTISLTKTDDWGIIGSAVPPYDWSRDVDMFYDGQRKMWEITADFQAGECKFRANDDWSLNYGSNANDGTLQSGGSNIPLATAGNYTIRFDPVKLTYTVKKN